MIKQKRPIFNLCDGYDNFGWEDQDVFALGVAYELDMVTLRAGYNYSEWKLAQERRKVLENLALIKFYIKLRKAKH